MSHLNPEFKLSVPQKGKQWLEHGSQCGLFPPPYQDQVYCWLSVLSKLGLLCMNGKRLFLPGDTDHLAVVKVLNQLSVRNSFINH